MAAPEPVPEVAGQPTADPEVKDQKREVEEEVEPTAGDESVPPQQEIDLEEIRGKFESLAVLLDTLPLFDMTVISPNPVRVWKHTGSDWTANWKPDSTQLGAGAEVQISQVQKVAKVSGKGWNENSEYWMGCVGENKFIRLINFRGVATVIPNLNSFVKRVEVATNRIHAMENIIESEKDRRRIAETRMKKSSERMLATDKAKLQTEERMRELEERFKEMEMVTHEKTELQEKKAEIAQREALEATVLRNYFERRMKDSEDNSNRLQQTVCENEEFIVELEIQLKDVESREANLNTKLEASERARAELERLMGQLQTKSEEEESEAPAEGPARNEKRKRKARKSVKSKRG